MRKAQESWGCPAQEAAGTPEGQGQPSSAITNRAGKRHSLGMSRRRATPRAGKVLCSLLEAYVRADFLWDVPEVLAGSPGL